MIYALLAGGLLGLWGLPLGLGWLGVLWGFFWVKAAPSLNWRTALGFLFILSHLQNGWVFYALLKGGDWPLWQGYPLFLSLLVFTYALLGLFLWVLTSFGGTKARVFLFPLGYYAFVWLRSEGLGLGGVGPIGSEPWISLFGPALPLVGARFADFLLISASLWLAWGILASKGRQRAWGLGLGLLAWLYTLGLFAKLPTQGEPVVLLVMPWSGVLGDSPSNEAVVKDYLSRFPKEPRLILLPESALPKGAEMGRDLEQLQSALAPGQAILVGGDRQELGGDQFVNYNALYYLTPGPFDFSLYKKQFLVPFAEYKPSWAEALGLPYLIPRSAPYRIGVPVFFNYAGVTFGPGICFEQYREAWYRDREASVQFYSFSSREFLFSPMGKGVLAQAGRVMARQSYKPVVKVVNGGLSGVVERPGQDLGRWVPKILAGEVEVRPVAEVSPYYRSGLYWTPLLVVGISFGLLATFREKRE